MTPSPSAAPESRLAPLRRLGAKVPLTAIAVVWGLGYALLRGRDTLTLAQADMTPLHRSLTTLYDEVGAGRNENPIFLYFFNYIRAFIDAFVTLIQGVIAQPAFGHPGPVLGWLGVVALMTWLAGVAAGWRYALLAAAGFLFLGFQGLWTESMDTLSLTFAAVLLALAIGIPIGIWMGLSDRLSRLVTPVLDFMQTMPTFVYLAPLTLFFLIGPASATIATLIYAVPPVMRITAHGIRGVSTTTVEASESLGATPWQTLTKVMLPMALRTIVLGANQTIMAALSMVTIAALIDAPGLGKTVYKALTLLDVGTAFNAGLAIVVLAIVLDRVTTAAAARVDDRLVTPRRRLVRRGVRWGGLGVVLVAGYLSHTYAAYADFPDNPDLGAPIRRYSESSSMWVQDHFSWLTFDVKDRITAVLINPVQSFLADSPWWLVVFGLASLAAVVGGRVAAASTVLCLGLIIGLGLWSDAMVTLASTLIATVFVLAFGLVVGVWMGRNARADQVIRPFLDAAQVMPAFVYLVPFLALFQAGRFTAIVAAWVYAVPVATKVVADGIREVSATTLEAATAAGSSTFQLIRKVQIPMAAKAIALATNQGLIYVLAMVVVGGLVGAGALGNQVVTGFSQEQRWGKGFAAGLAIVLLGVMLDRVTQRVAQRVDPGAPRR